VTQVVSVYTLCISTSGTEYIYTYIYVLTECDSGCVCIYILYSIQSLSNCCLVYAVADDKSSNTQGVEHLVRILGAVQIVIAPSNSIIKGVKAKFGIRKYNRPNFQISYNI
jgi:hypothetical protein